MKAHSSYILSFLFLLCGCSSEIAEEAGKIIEKPVPILINTPKQIDVETKAVVNAFTTDNISYIKIYKTDNLYSDGISPYPNSLNSQLKFDSPVVYPVDGSDVTIYSYYPSYIQNTNQPTTANEIAFSISGQDDLMYASAQAGNKSNPISVNLTFDHKLAQIKFKLKSQITDSLEPGSSVSIIATGPNEGTMDLTNGDLHIASVTTGTFTLPTGFTLEQLNGETEVPGELLLFPQSEYSFSLQIGDSYYPVTFEHQTLTTSWNESSVYTLTISINSLSNPKSTPVVKEDI
ncbi:fimbrillin family protein [uncultured Parabacteroides sp.]|uniref:fimbrillin family protein n=1 Tax=uncultured Parabacteroides sp. TaxID=512312 RepID=UPI002589EE9F|nr:fimbrillin family protein [uncultured Parabacteroides sp.]